MVEVRRPTDAGPIQQPDVNQAPPVQEPAARTPVEPTRTETPHQTDDYSSTSGAGSQTPSTELVSGARGPGTPVGPRGQDVAPPLRPGPEATRVDRATYLKAHRDDPVAARGIVAQAEIWAPAAGQNWQALVRQVYGPQLPDNVTPEAIALLAEAVGMVNGRSTLEALPSMIAVPQLEDLNRFLQGMRRDMAVGNERIVRNAVLRYAGENPQTTEMPTPGRAYEAKWNDNLRGIALHAYRDQLVGLEPEETDRRLRSIMLSIAYVNGLNSTDMADAGVIWMPPVDRIRGFIGRMHDPARLHRLRGDNRHLWRSIRRTGTGAVRDLAYNRDQTITPGTSASDLASTIDSTDSAVRMARFIRVMSSAPPQWGFWGIFSFPWLFELYSEEPPNEDELPIRRDNEDFTAYLDRVAPNMPPEEYRRVLENPGRFMMRAAGIMNGNGDIDSGRGELFAQVMQQLGIADADGRIVVTPNDGETLPAATDRVTVEAMRRVGVQFESEPGDSFEQVLRNAQTNATPQQQQLLRQLTIWNQLVQFNAEGAARPTPGESTLAAEMSDPGSVVPDPGSTAALGLGSDLGSAYDSLFGPGVGYGYGSDSTGSDAEFTMLLGDILSASNYGYSELYEGPECHEYPEYGEVLDNWYDIDIDPDYGTFYDEISEEDQAEDRAAAKMIEENLMRQREAQRVDVSGEDELSRRSRAKSTQAVIDRDHDHAHEVMEEAIDQTVEVNQQEARGEHIGGPGRRRRGS